MANIRIKDMATASSVDDTDSIVVDGSTIGTKRMSLSSLWDWIVGRHGKDIPADADLNTYTKPGTYRMSTTPGSSTLNKPYGLQSPFIMDVRRNQDDSSLMQIIRTYRGDVTYTRSGNSSGWTMWLKSPESVNPLQFMNHTMSRSITVNAGTSMNFRGFSTALILCQNWCGVYNSNASDLIVLNQGSGISVEKNANGVNIANSGESPETILLMGDLANFYVI